MSITICDTHLVRTVRYLSLTFEPVYFSYLFVTVFLEGYYMHKTTTRLLFENVFY